MIGKYWKKVGLIIVVIACLFNIVTKIVSKASIKDELESSVLYVKQQQYEEEAQKNKE